MLKRLKSVSMMLFLMGASTGAAYAVANPGVADVKITQQSGACTGIVKDATGEGVIGASVVVKGTTNGTITGLDGDFSLSNVKEGDVIVISFVGYTTQEVKWTGASLNILLKDDTQLLGEVVVTALGMKREQKALGYAVTEVKGDELRTANTISPVAALQGKVAGVEIAQSDGGMFGSTKIQIRGASTLSGNNQPIYVVDGIILDNAISNGEAAGNSGDMGIIKDYGNELKNLNPDDFETISVLKGAAATALYGSRGLNGAVVITTKSGKSGKGLGINISQTFGVDYVYKQPDLQNEYGDGAPAGWVDYGTKDAQGNYYKFDPMHQFYMDSNGQRSLLPSGNWGGYAWGPRFDGSPIMGYDGEMTTYNPVKNNYKDAYNLGFNSNTNVSIQGGNEKTTFYTSLSYKYADGTLPNNSFQRLAGLFKASHKLGKKVMLEASMSFANSMPKNSQPALGQFFSSYIYSFDDGFGRSYDTKYYRNKYKGEHGGLAQTSYNDKYGKNPVRQFWFNLYEFDYTQKETSVRPTVNVNVDIFDWLKFKAEGNFNYYYKRAETKELGSGYANDGGKYAMTQYTKEQTNLNATFTGNKQFGNLEVHGFLRGEYYNNIVQETNVYTNGGLVVPGQYYIGNSKNQAGFSGVIKDTKRMMSVAFQVGASWKSQLYLDVTGRNDWSSALVYTNQTGNYSYFYPSVSGSWLISETFRDKLPEWISLAKVRASWAQVGNDTSPYAINQGYTLSSWQFSNNYTYGLSLPNKAMELNLKPERKNAWEVGLDWRFIDNRINLDVTYYKENIKDQIMDIAVPSVSGVSQQRINAGNIQNSGIEVALNTVPFRNKDWEWTLDFTYTKNSGKIISLHPNVANYITLTNGGGDYANIKAVAKVGAEYGLLVSNQTAKIDPATGKEILAYSGDATRYAYAQRDGEEKEIGSVVPDFLGSVSTGLTWKNLSLRVALDMRFGGYIAAYGSRYGDAIGTTKNSLKYRDAEHGGVTWTSKFDGITYSDGVVPNGIFPEGTKIGQADGTTYVVPTGGQTFEELYNKGLIEPTHASAWTMQRNSWGRGVINDSWFKKLNYIALREVSLFYRLPASVATKIGAKALSVGLTGRNLGYLLNSMPNHENPESVRGTATTEFRAASFSAFTASYMLNINASF